METVNKDRVLAMIIKTFFRYFTLGVIEAKHEGANIDRLEPADIKRIMLEHYGDISKVFNQEVFFSIARMNFSAETMEQEIRSSVSPATTAMDLVRIACRTDDFYNTMVSEYKRNFELLMYGHLATADEHEKNYTRCLSMGTMATDTAIDIINKMMGAAYAEGLKMRTTL